MGRLHSFLNRRDQVLPQLVQVHLISQGNTEDTLLPPLAYYHTPVTKALRNWCSHPHSTRVLP